MGMYLGQLPPAEIARLKAELAETIITNFCYPRFFDYRTNSLRMRPVDRTKRQEVWLYLSSVDFTAWNRVDVMSPDLQRHIERLFIQFVQRNRNFFGQQGRKRMPDVRTLITSSSATLVQGLRTHVSGQRKERQPAFGSPRPVASWSTMGAGGRTELSWEQVSAMTQLLQQQLQEMRGEPKSNSAQDMRSSQLPDTTDAPVKRNGRVAPTRIEQGGPKSAKSTNGANGSVLPQPGKGTSPLNPAQVPNTIPSQAAPLAQPVQPAQPVRITPSTPLTPVTTPAATVEGPTLPDGVAKKQESTPPLGPLTSISGVETLPDVQHILVPPTVTPASGVQDVEQIKNPALQHGNVTAPPVTPNTPPHVAIPTISPQAASPVPQEPASASSAVLPEPTQPTQPVQSVSAIPVSPLAPVPALDASVESRAGRDMQMLLVGDEDIAIFEQLRHQVILWLRVEAVHAGVEMTGQGPAQLLDQLRRQERFDETRLQVVSTLLNLSNQVIKSKRVSVLDYKQALMFHLMHTKR